MHYDGNREQSRIVSSARTSSKGRPRLNVPQYRHQFLHKPGQAQEQANDHRHELRHEGNGLVLHLGERLRETDEQADDHADDQQGGRQQERHHQRLLGKRYGIVGGHHLFLPRQQRIR